jgi:succinyl-CoA synthetase beta subunit
MHADMNIGEHASKRFISEAGIRVPTGMLATTPEQAENAAADLGRVMVKAQVPAGRRGKAGGILSADTLDEAHTAAGSLLGSEIGGQMVIEVLVEQRVEIDRELFLAVVNDPESGGYTVMFSIKGGMDVEEIMREQPELLRQITIDPRLELEHESAVNLAEGAGLGPAANEVAAVLVRLQRVHRDLDAELIEINPLAIDSQGGVVALDCKLVIDDSALGRQPRLAVLAGFEPQTDLERAASQAGLRYIELDGDIGLLANGAGLTMATMDVIAHLGGRPANFLEIGGDAYTKGHAALELVLSNPRVRSLVVSFCGAFARTDVMVDGLTSAWTDLQPDVPAFFSVHGTGAVAATAMLRERLGIEPYPTMEDAVTAAIAAPSSAQKADR